MIETCVLPKMFFLIAFFLGIIYQILVYGNSHKIDYTSNQNLTVISSDGVSHESNNSDRTTNQGHSSGFPGTDATIPTKEYDDKVPGKGKDSTDTQYYMRSPLWGMMTFTGVKDLNPLGPQDNPDSISIKDNPINNYESSTTTVKPDVTRDLTTSKMWSPFFQILGTKFIQTIITNEGHVSKTVQEQLPSTSDKQKISFSSAEGLHSALQRSVKTAGSNVTNTKHINKKPASSVLQSFVVSQFSWVDVIITIGCTAAVLIILVNLVVCVRYVQRRGKHIQLKGGPQSINHAYRLKFEDFQLANSPSPVCFSIASSQKSTKMKNIDCENAIKSCSRNSSSLGSGKSIHTEPSAVTDAATQYESTDAILASFMTSDLIVELNDRDSTCTSISDGFVFTRDYSTSHLSDGLTAF